MIVRHPRARYAGRALSLAGVAISMVGLLTTAIGYSLGNHEAAATVRSAGGAADLTTGNSATVFTLGLPAGAACAGDSAIAGYRWQTYMVRDSVDPATLTFGSVGPLPPGQNADFRQPLYGSPGGTPVVNQQTANADDPNGPGRILNIPDASYSVFGPNVIDPGTYNIGIACTLGPAGPDQTKNFWNVQKTFVADTAGGGPSAVTWTLATTNLPTVTTVAGATTTTVGATTTTAGVTTTTIAGTTTTTTAGATTTTAETTTTTGELSIASSDESASPSSGAGVGQLSRTGGLSTSLVFWAALLLIFGRMAVLFVRSPDVRQRRPR